MIRPEALLIAFVLAPGAMFNILGFISLLFFSLIIFSFFVASVRLWLEFPASTAMYLILSSSIYAFLKATLAARARKIVDLGEEPKVGISEIVLSIPMGIALIVAVYLWCVGFISLIYSNFYILLFIGAAIVTAYFLRDFIYPWIAQPKQRQPNSEDS